MCVAVYVVPVLLCWCASCTGRTPANKILESHIGVISWLYFNKIEIKYFPYAQLWLM